MIPQEGTREACCHRHLGRDSFQDAPFPRVEILEGAGDIQPSRSQNETQSKSIGDGTHPQLAQISAEILQPIPRARRPSPTANDCIEYFGLRERNAEVVDTLEDLPNNALVLGLDYVDGYAVLSNRLAHGMGTTAQGAPYFRVFGEPLAKIDGIEEPMDRDQEGAVSSILRASRCPKLIVLEIE